MELPKIGNNCVHPGCNQLDFLPLQCKCGKLFCSDHFKLHAVNCPCNTGDVQGEIRKIEDTYKCSEPGCSTTSIVPLICEKCNQHFCIVHRHIVACSPPDAKVLAEAKEKYAAPVIQFNEAKAAVDKQVDQNIENAKKKAKNSGMANKVQLMRIKNKATGLKTIPVADRVYFNVYHPGNSEKVSPIFVSKAWSVGRAIDSIAEEMKLQNNNNKSNSLKLRLFVKETCHILSEDLSKTLEWLLKEHIIVDGENLIMEYVADACISLNNK